MQKLNLIAKEQSGLLIVDLNFHYTAQEIHKLANQEKAERTKINQILQPKSPHPQLYGLFLNLARILPVKVHKMEISYRQTFGINLNQSLTAIFKIYTRTANGLLPQSVAKQKLLELIDDISAVLIILNEIKALDVSTESRLGTLISDIRITIEKDLK